jgi:hypothetical protein
LPRGVDTTARQAQDADRVCRVMPARAARVARGAAARALRRPARHGTTTLLRPLAPGLARHGPGLVRRRRAVEAYRVGRHRRERR